MVGARLWYIMITLAPRLQGVTTVSLLLSSDMTGALPRTCDCHVSVSALACVNCLPLFFILIHTHAKIARSVAKMLKIRSVPHCFSFLKSYCLIHHSSWLFFRHWIFDRARRGILCCSTWKEIQMLVITASSWAIFSKKSVKAPLTSSNFCHVMTIDHWPLAGIVTVLDAVCFVLLVR